MAKKAKRDSTESQETKEHKDGQLVRLARLLASIQQENLAAVLNGKKPKKIDAGLIGLLVALATHVDTEGHCFPSQETLGDRLGRSRDWVNLGIKALVAEGHITKRRQISGSEESSCIYYIPALDMRRAMSEIPTAEPATVSEIPTPKNGKAAKTHVGNSDTNCSHVRSSIQSTRARKNGSGVANLRVEALSRRIRHASSTALSLKTVQPLVEAAAEAGRIDDVQAVADDVIGSGYPAWTIIDKLEAILTPTKPTTTSKKKRAKQGQAESPADTATTPLDKAWHAAKQSVRTLKPGLGDALARASVADVGGIVEITPGTPGDRISLELNVSDILAVFRSHGFHATLATQATAAAAAAVAPKVEVAAEDRSADQLGFLRGVKPPVPPVAEKVDARAENPVADAPKAKRGGKGAGKKKASPVAKKRGLASML